MFACIRLPGPPDKACLIFAPMRSHDVSHVRFDGDMSGDRTHLNDPVETLRHGFSSFHDQVPRLVHKRSLLAGIDAVSSEEEGERETWGDACKPFADDRVWYVDVSGGFVSSGHAVCERPEKRVRLEREIAGRVNLRQDIDGVDVFDPCGDDEESWGAGRRQARHEMLHARCRNARQNVGAWLAFAEYQSSFFDLSTGAPSHVVRERQLCILNTALQENPGDANLLRAICRAEDLGNMGPVRLQEERWARLLECNCAEVAEELVWSYFGAVMNGAAVPVVSVRDSALEVLGVLATRKAAARHDGQACTAWERAELAVISSLAFAELYSGYTKRLLALLRSSAMLATFFPGRTAASLRDSWTDGTRLGDGGGIHVLQRTRIETAWRDVSCGSADASLSPTFVRIWEVTEQLFARHDVSQQMSRGLVCDHEPHLCPHRQHVATFWQVR